MTISTELIDLLLDVRSGACDAGCLSRWLPQKQLRFLESSNELERIFVADLDAVLAEVVEGRADSARLREAAKELLAHFKLAMSS